MGMYTLFHASFCLKIDAPADVKSALFKLSDGQNPELDHEFFKSERCTSLFRCSSAYFLDREQELNSVSNGHEYDQPEQVVVRVSSSLKNYGSEIEKFVDWVKPYIDMKSGPVIYSRYEETERNKIHVGPSEILQADYSALQDYTRSLEAKLSPTSKP